MELGIQICSPATEIEPQNYLREPSQLGKRKKAPYRNTKSLVLKEFVKQIKKDTAQILMIKERKGFKISIKDFMKVVESQIPDDTQYIRIDCVESLCQDDSASDHSKIMRILLHRFLKTDYELLILNKNKRRA